MALVVLSVVEQRLDAVRAVLDGASVTEIAARVGVSRQSVHTWIRRYLSEGVAGLTDRSHRPSQCPHQVAEVVEVTVAEMRREHPRWGAKRIRLELLRTDAQPPAWHADRALQPGQVPATATINRILLRQGLARARPRKRPRESYRRFERPAPMQLWGIDIVGGIQLVDVRTGLLSEAKLLTGIDDHSRYCVIAQVLVRATGRAVCVAFAQALARFGVPAEVITDNGKQFTDRFGRHGTRNGEVLFDTICRRNGITHLLTAPASPNQNGKVERFHGTLRPDFLTDADPFETIEAAQAAVDTWVADYNTNRPHQGLDEQMPVTPADRFTPTPQAEWELVELWLPPSVVTTAELVSNVVPAPVTGAVEFDRVVPACGMISVRDKLLWLGQYRTGKTAHLWADVDVIHVLVDGVRVKTVRSHLSTADLTALRAQGAVPAGAPPLPAPEQDSDAVEVDRVVTRVGTVCLGGRLILAAEILAGRSVSIRIEAHLLMFFDPVSRELLRTRPNPLTAQDLTHVRGVRKAGPPPRPSLEPVRAQRRASNTGVIMIAGQKIALGRANRHRTVTVLVAADTITVDYSDGDTRTFRRTTDQPVRSIKGQRPRNAPSVI